MTPIAIRKAPSARRSIHSQAERSTNRRGRARSGAIGPSIGAALDGQVALGKVSDQDRATPTTSAASPDDDQGDGRQVESAVGYATEERSLEAGRRSRANHE